MPPLTPERRKRLQAQLKKAENIQRNSKQFGSESETKPWWLAKKVIDRTRKILGHKHTSPSKKQSSGPLTEENVRATAEIIKRSIKAPGKAMKKMKKVERTSGQDVRPVRMGRGVSRSSFERSFRDEK